MIFKWCLVFAVCTCGVVSELTYPDAKHKCIKELFGGKVFDDELNYFISNGEYPRPGKENQTCFFKCIAEKTGIVNNDFKLNKTKLEGSYNNNREEPILIFLHPKNVLDDCSLETKSRDRCEAGYEFMKCAYDVHNVTRGSTSMLIFVVILVIIVLCCIAGALWYARRKKRELTVN